MFKIRKYEFELNHQPSPKTTCIYHQRKSLGIKYQYHLIKNKNKNQYHPLRPQKSKPTLKANCRPSIIV